MVKDCPPGKIRNPATGRCIDQNGAIAKRAGLTAGAGPTVAPAVGPTLGPTVAPVPAVASPKVSTNAKPCPPGKVRNPKTGRCIKDMSGFKPVFPPKASPKASPKRKKSPKPCPPGKVRNPKTGRCINEKGVAKPKTPKPKTPKPKTPKPKTKASKCADVKCDDKSICNPGDGQCYSLTGAFGKYLLKKHVLSNREGPYFKINTRQYDTLEKVRTYLLDNEGYYLQHNPDMMSYLEDLLSPEVARSKNLRDLIQRILDQRKKTEKRYPTLYTEDTQTYNTLPLAEIKRLRAVSFYKYVLGGKTFYLIGEVHIPLSGCKKDSDNIVYISGLVRSVVSHFKDRKYDLYFETEMIDKIDNPQMGIGGMSIGFAELKKQYFQCIDLPRLGSCGDNLRVHYVDFRFKLSMYNQIYDMYYNKLTPPQDMDKEILTVITSKKMMKQFESIPDTELRQKIYSYYFNKIAGKIANKTDRILDRVTLIMDMYASARMFRKFSDDYSATNIIYYAGDAHVLNVRSLLKYLGAKEISSVGVEKGEKYISDCLQIDAVALFT